MGTEGKMEVRLFATLRKSGTDNIIFKDWYEGVNGFALLESLNIDACDAAIFLINGTHSKLDDELKPNDVIAIFPPVGGG